MEFVSCTATVDRTCFSVNAIEGNEIIGQVRLWIYGEDCHLSDLWVSETHRRTGIASELVKRCLEKADQTEAILTNLKVEKTNEVAIRLYKRFGFSICISEEKFYWMSRSKIESAA